MGKKKNKHKDRVDLAQLATEPPAGLGREQALAKTEKLGVELFELQELLWGAKTHSVLVVLQGRDTGGKDGTIKNVVGCLNPRGVAVTSFGVPTEEELAHDFLWRVHRHAPRTGWFAIFNRSHYEDLLVVRVHNLVPKAVWRKRFEQINAFETLLAESGTIIVKYFLNISK
jgi:polyphosphate kinase 2 (PPK2 family)